MKWTTLCTLGFVLSLCAATFAFHSDAKGKPQAPAATANRKPVLVELFTAEGCSSLPGRCTACRAQCQAAGCRCRDHSIRGARRLLESGRLDRPIFFPGLDRATE